METKKSKKASLENKRFIFFEIGLIVALLLTLLAFEWKSRPSETTMFYGRTGDYIDEEQIPITRQQKEEPPPPPPPINPFELNIVDNETILDIQPEFDNVEAHINQEYDFSDLSMLPEESVTEEAFFLVEEMPRFMGRDANTFSSWIQRNMIYPQSAVQNRISGRIQVYFEISSTGEVVNVKMLKGLNPELDKEVIRVILSSNGLWTPGQQRGRPVKVQFNFPINFILN
ncbi:MAG: energy transducer TonB [Bacteroidales bacterium]|nr:energy transducer TonB [Bacteroidales bacterium]